MRNGILGVLGEIIIHTLSKEELDVNAKKVRDQMFDHLEVSLPFAYHVYSIKRCRAYIIFVFFGTFSLPKFGWVWLVQLVRSLPCDHKALSLVSSSAKI